MSSVWVGKQHVKCLNGLLFAFRLDIWGCVGTSRSVFHGGIHIKRFILPKFCPYIVLCGRMSELGVESRFRGNSTENEKLFQQGPSFEISFIFPLGSCFLNFFST